MTDRPDDMPALDPAATALLAGYRRQRPAMPARSRDRIEHLLRDPHAERRHARRVPWIVGLALAAACVLWLRRAAPVHQPHDAASLSPAHERRAPPFWQAHLRTTIPRRPTPAALPPPPQDITPPPQPPPPRKRVEKRDPPPEPTKSDLAREQELLAAGWRALAAGDARAANAAASAHAETFPAGILTPERQALTAIATCTLEPARGTTLARKFLAAQPRSPLARRVREGCGLTP